LSSAFLKHVVFTDDLAGAGKSCRAPIFGRHDFFHPIQLADAFKSIINQLPRTRLVRINRSQDECGNRGVFSFDPDTFFLNETIMPLGPIGVN
jgi:hypothetical protein